MNALFAKGDGKGLIRRIPAPKGRAPAAHGVSEGREPFPRSGLTTRLHGRTLPSCCNYPNWPRASVYEASERDYRLVLLTEALSRLDGYGRADMSGIGVLSCALGEFMGTRRALDENPVSFLRLHRSTLLSRAGTAWQPRTDGLGL